MRKIVLISTILLFMLPVFPGFAEKVATVFSISGDVKVVRKGSNIGITCKEGMKIKALDWIKTGSGSSVTLAFDDKADNVIKVEENSLVILKLDGYFKIQLLEGQIYAILENVEHGEIFRALTPSAVTESTSSAWVVNSEGTYTSVVVVDGEAFVCGINKDGTIKKHRFKIQEGYGRTTKMYEDPGEPTATPANVLSWFHDQVVQHHLDKVIANRIKTQTGTRISKHGSKSTKGSQSVKRGGRKRSKKSSGKGGGGGNRGDPEGTDDNDTDYYDDMADESSGIDVPVGSSPRPTKSRGTTVIDGKEVDFLEYLYRGRLEEASSEDEEEK